jgi:diaminopimelate decarboxylase
MFISDSFGVNQAGRLTIGGADAVELAARYGTPLYVMDEDGIRGACRRYKEAIRASYGENGGAVAFASKAFCCKAMCRIVAEEGLGLDVVSDGEILTALAADVPPERIIFHGNNKTTEELSLALRSGVGRIAVDNLFELELVNQLAASIGVTAKIFFRVKPGVDPHTFQAVRTGGVDSKFGLGLENGEAFEAVKRAIQLDNIELMGINRHIGSQIFDISAFELAAEVMVGFIVKVKDELGFTLRELNLGGGFPIRYLDTDGQVVYADYIERVSKVVKKACAAGKLDMPFIIIEPGRSIVSSFGATLYKVGGIKEIAGVRTYVIVDGGMGDNPRYALYKSEYSMVIANKASQPLSTRVTVAGRYCESGDMLGENVPLQEAAAGDVLAVLATGAYNYAMAMNYNRVPKAAVVMISEGTDRLAVRRETPEDVARNDIEHKKLPPRREFFHFYERKSAIEELING